MDDPRNTSLMRYYALTITPISRKPQKVNTFDNALDRYEKKLKVKITNRHYEIAPLTRKLHVHCLMEQSKNNDYIHEFNGQKNHNICFKPCVDVRGWIEYSSKEKKKELIPRKWEVVDHFHFDNIGGEADTL